MKPRSSLFAKILSWFFLNLILVVGLLAVFFAFQPHINLHALFGQQGSPRLRATGLVIAHDLSQTARANWPEILARHATIHGVDFVLVLADGSRFSSTGTKIPIRAMGRIRRALRRLLRRAPRTPPGLFSDLLRRPEDRADGAGQRMKSRLMEERSARHAGWYDRRPPLMFRTRDPTLYWTGIPIPISIGASGPPRPGLLLAVSDSVTGNGFFFDPVPWMVVAAAVVLISVLLWIPMVRNITRPLSRMTRTTEEIAKGRFDVTIHEPRADEIGRLARAINHMTSRLFAFVSGQKRFLGDVAHELGSPLARIQFGLGALEQRVNQENRQRVIDVMEDVEHLSTLVNELLAFSRADIRSNTVKLEKIDLLPPVQTAVKRESTPTADIVVDIDPDIRVVASSELVTRAVANLVRNAVKYAADAGPISIIAEKKKKHVEIQVRDNGSGVPEDLLDQLFEPFFRPQPSRNRESGGVGLGLAIVKTCIEACKGTVSARNLQPKGFAVTISLNMP